MANDSDKPDHDGSYRTLFAQPALVEQFLETFAPDEVVQTLRFEQMTPMGTTFLAQNLARRYTDCLWRIPTDGNPLYLCLLIEFQSTVDSFMAVRVATYVCLLYEHLIETDKKGLEQGLPPVLPIVLYNGIKAWNANREIASFVPVLAGSVLERLQLQMGYLLIDIARLTDEDKPEIPNLVSTLFEMDRASHTEEQETIDGLFERLITLTEAHPGRVALRRALVIFFNGVLHHRGALMPSDTLNDLMEVRTMFSNIDINLQKKYEEGREEGEERGEIKGRQKGALGVALNLLASRFNADEDQWRARLDLLDEAQLNDFILRLVSASSLEELGH